MFFDLKKRFKTSQQCYFNIVYAFSYQNDQLAKVANVSHDLAIYFDSISFQNEVLKQ